MINSVGQRLKYLYYSLSGRSEVFCPVHACLLTRLCCSNRVPVRVAKTKDSGPTPAGLRVERISIDFALKGTDRLLR